MEENRKHAEEFQREYANEQKLLEAAEQEKASGSTSAGARDHGKAGEDGDEAIINQGEAVIKEEDEDVGHRSNEPTEAQTPRFEPGSAFDTDVGILRCGTCRSDKTVSSHQAGYCYSSMTEYIEHEESGYHSRKAQTMRSFNLVKGRVVRNKAECCGGWWTAEEFVGHLAEKHPDL